MNRKSTLRNILFIYLCLFGLGGGVEQLKADEIYGGPNQPENIVTMTEYLSDSVFVFHYREKYENANHKIVFYPGLKCKILDEEARTCQLIGLEFANLWIYKCNIGYYEICYAVRDCPITNIQMEDLHSVPTGMVNGYTIVSWLGGISLFDSANDLKLFTTQVFEGPVVTRDESETFYLRVFSKLKKVPDIIFTEEKKGMSFVFVGPNYADYIPEINREFWVDYRFIRPEDSATQKYYEPTNFRFYLNCEKKVKDMIVENFQSVRYKSEEELTDEEKKLLDWLFVAKRPLNELYDFLPVPRNIYPHRR